LDVEEHESEHEQKTTSLNFEQRVIKIKNFLEVLNVHDFVEDKDNLDEESFCPKMFCC